MSYRGWTIIQKVPGGKHYATKGDRAITNSCLVAILWAIYSEDTK